MSWHLNRLEISQQCRDTISAFQFSLLIQNGKVSSYFSFFDLGFRGLPCVRPPRPKGLSYMMSTQEGEVCQLIQRSRKWLVRGLVKFVPAVACLFCLAPPGSCLARFTNLLRALCRPHEEKKIHIQILVIWVKLILIRIVYNPIILPCQSRGK